LNTSKEERTGQEEISQEAAVSFADELVLLLMSYIFLQRDQERRRRRPTGDFCRVHSTFISFYVTGNRDLNASGLEKV
jgi:hypothetical protein